MIREVVGWPTDPAVRSELEQAVGKPLPTYENSVIARCSKCGDEIVLGPRSASLMQLGVAAPVCWMCAAKTYLARRDAGQEEMVFHLGNTPKAEPEN